MPAEVAIVGQNATCCPHHVRGLREMPLEFDQWYEDALGETRINLTLAGHEALVEAIGGECPHCGRAMAEGELH